MLRLRVCSLVECVVVPVLITLGIQIPARGAIETKAFLDLLDVFFWRGVIAFDVIVGQGQEVV